MSKLADLLKEAGGSTTAFNKNSPVGTTFSGPVLSVNVRGSIDPKTGKPDTWDDGNPKEQVSVTVQTALRDPNIEEDDGSRTIYIKWWGAQKQALVQALRNASVEDIEIGGMFTATYMGEGPQPDNKALSPAKLYSYSYRAPSAAAGLIQSETSKPPVTSGFMSPPEQPLPPTTPTQHWETPTAANAGTLGQAAAKAPLDMAATVAAPAA
jgi:hypothetical protein